ncbi:hypothetical protein K3W96_15060, partial [Listeria monocytogenes]|nr:hypothetical protein [Listeria monocytogenes]
VIPHALIEEHSPWHAVSFGHDGASMGWHGNALLVRKGSEIRAATSLHLPALEPRGAIRADVVIGHHAIRVLGMHLD